MNTLYFKDLAHRYLDLGYEPIPIPIGEKYPAGLENWQNIEISHHLIDQFVAGMFSQAGVGIRTEQCPAVDVDILDQVVVQKVIQLVEEVTGGQHPLLRVGRPPKALLPFRTDTPFTKITSKKYRSPDGREHRIEILATGQQFVANAIHPSTGNPYVWEGPSELIDFPRKELPLLTLETALDIIQRFESKIVPSHWIAVEKGIKGRPMEDSDPAYPALPTDITAERLEKILVIQDADGYGNWIRVGMAIHHQTGGSQEGFEIWDRWSERSGKHDKDVCREKWASFDAQPKRRPITVRTLIKEYNLEFPEEIGDEAVTLNDLWFYMPTGQCLYVPTRELWTGAAVNKRIPPVPVGDKAASAATWLSQNRPIEQMIWTPKEPEIIRDKVFQFSGEVPHPGATVFNQYRAPVIPDGRADKAGPWIDHIRRIYPDDWQHIISWLAQRVQQPGIKVNHAIVLGGMQGIGKDTLLEPVKKAVGSWNWSDISPVQMLGRFNGWVKAVVVRISEARDLGEANRFAFYEHSKTVIAAPPDVIRVDEKHLREVNVANVCGVIFTTNNATDGLYLPADDRRHYVAWSTCTKDDFPESYWRDLYSWYRHGGDGHVCQYLLQFDLSRFDPKAPPPKTPAFWQIVATSESPESGELRDVLDALDNPDAVTLDELIYAASARFTNLCEELRDHKNRRKIPHRMDRVGYVSVRNQDAGDGLFKVGGKRQVIYARRELSLFAQLQAAKGKL